MLSREQYRRFLERRPLDDCPFCDTKAQIVLKEEMDWLWVVNKAPYWRYSTLLIPKRHFSQFLEMTGEEFKEFKEMLGFALSKYQKADIRLDDGTKAKKYLFLWTQRGDFWDTIWKVVKPDHFHFHLMPDKEHSFDPLLDETAYLFDTVEKLK